MRIEYLEEFEALATTLSFSKVAKQFHESTSVLSRHISSLETEVGDKLFARDTTSVVLTPVGQKFFEGIVPVLDQYRTFMRQFANDPIRTQRQLNITLVRSSGILKKTAAPAAAQLSREHGVSVVYTVNPNQGAPDDYAPLFDGRADAMVTYASSHIPDALHTTVLHDDPFLAIVPVAHPLAANRSISLVRDLSKYKTTVLKSPAYQAGINVVEDAFARFGVVPQYRYLFVQSQDELCFSPTFEDVLPIPASALSRHPYVSPETHVVLPFEEDVSFTMVLVHRPDRDSEALESFRQTMVRLCQESAEAELAQGPAADVRA